MSATLTANKEAIIAHQAITAYLVDLKNADGSPSGYANRPVVHLSQIQGSSSLWIADFQVSGLFNLVFRVDAGEAFLVYTPTWLSYELEGGEV